MAKLESRPFVPVPIWPSKMLSPVVVVTESWPESALAALIVFSKVMSPPLETSVCCSAVMTSPESTNPTITSSP